MILSVTNVIVGLTVLVSYMSLNNRELFDKLKHYPYQESRTGQYYRWLSSGFVHGSMMHLIINMYVLYQFGNLLEQYYMLWFPRLGKILFLFMYLATVIAADIPTFLKHKDNPRFSSIGASGATSGILLVFCMLRPWEWLLFPPVPYIVFGVLFVGYSVYAGKQAKSGGIDHDAHLWGAIFGLLITIGLKPELVTDFIYKIQQLPDLPF